MDPNNNDISSVLENGLKGKKADLKVTENPKDEVRMDLYRDPEGADAHWFCTFKNIRVERKNALCNQACRQWRRELFLDYLSNVQLNQSNADFYLKTKDFEFIEKGEKVDLKISTDVDDEILLFKKCSSQCIKCEYKPDVLLCEERIVKGKIHQGWIKLFF